MRRLDALALLAFVPLCALAQTKVYRIAVLERESAEANATNFNALKQGLRELGYIEGKNLWIEYRSADGLDARYRALCAEAVAMKVDFIVVRGTRSTIACKKARSTIPIIFAAAADPVGDGLVAILASPGANVTGLSTATNQLVAKRLEILRDMRPKTSHIAALLNLGNPTIVSLRKQLDGAAQTLGIRVKAFDVRSPDDLKSGMEQAAKLRVDAVYVPVDSLTEANRNLIAELALKHKLATINSEPSYVDAGGLLSYGNNNVAGYRKVGTLADKIFKGAKPGDIPVEQPSTLMMVINLKTAKAIGLTIPKEVLFRADRVIQ